MEKKDEDKEKKQPAIRKRLEGKRKGGMKEMGMMNQNPIIPNGKK